MPGGEGRQVVVAIEPPRGPPQFQVEEPRRDLPEPPRRQAGGDVILQQGAKVYAGPRVPAACSFPGWDSGSGKAAS